MTWLKSCHSLSSRSLFLPFSFLTVFGLAIHCLVLLVAVLCLAVLCLAALSLVLPDFAVLSLCSHWIVGSYLAALRLPVDMQFRLSLSRRSLLCHLLPCHSLSCCSIFRPFSVLPFSVSPFSVLPLTTMFSFLSYVLAVLSLLVASFAGWCVAFIRLWPALLCFADLSHAVPAVYCLGHSLTYSCLLLPFIVLLFSALPFFFLLLSILPFAVLQLSCRSQCCSLYRYFSSCLVSTGFLLVLPSR